MSEGEIRARNPAIAGVLSLLLPGLGQLYNGQPGLALGVCLVVYGSALLGLSRVIALLGATDPRPLITGVLVPVGVFTMGWIGSVVLAVFTALDRPEYELRPYNRGLVYAGLLVFVYVVFPVATTDGVLRWLLARNGIRTPEQVAAWGARVEALRASARQRGTAVADSMVEIPNLEIATPPDPEVLARDAATVIHLVLVGGPDGGVYDVFSTPPSCTYRGGAAPSWANLYTDPSDSLGITAVQLQVDADTGTTRAFQLSVNVGNLPTGRSYVVDGRSVREDTPPSAVVERRGAGAVLRLVGTTETGVRVEATVQCRVLAAP
ncbi:MAG: hypothetical protein IPI38_14080 [Gemmatimonadetes bacterium]|jgi:hypothetical protein|nr:hypothetical protein [Gemmatimonadota bacterium]MBK7349519.1 hypothetical protein [Gemmatimonadota bacterium]MBK7716533.1 hypothetical protein [Gemmatimonadota bacterium]MBK7784149.1 hypothetical protein [Gemmatimonadota bacterium]MBK7925079.1 hypothetical protein [Gemmatimonadota bacterium]